MQWRQSLDFIVHKQRSRGPAQESLRAVYEVIDDEHPYYGEVPELKGVWATGKTPEESRENLQMGYRGLDSLEFMIQPAHTNNRGPKDRSGSGIDQDRRSPSGR